MAAKKDTANIEISYGEQSISSLKGADRVRRRPAVIFGSDGLEGCQHSFFEIVANSVDEAREGYGDRIVVTAFADHSIEVEDYGRGVPLGYNKKEGKYNWELVFCELYAGGKYDNNSEGASYSYSLGLNGLGACATQYSSEYMEVRSYNGKQLSAISFKKGAPVTELSVTELEKGARKKHGTVIRWKPDIEVFTDIDIPYDHFEDILHRQSIVNSGITFVLREEQPDGSFAEKSYYYEHGIADYIRELTDGTSLTEPVLWKLETKGRDRADKPEYKLHAEIAFCVTKTEGMSEYYHNSSYLEYGGSPDKAVRSAFTSSIDSFLRQKGIYNKTEAKITYPDVAESLYVIISSASTETSYENQTKKAINNTFITKALTDFIKSRMEIWLAERPTEAETFARQVLLNKRSRETAERAKVDVRKKLAGSMDLANRVEKFVPCHSKDPTIRELYIVEGDSALTSCKLARDAEFQAIIPVRGKTLNCMKSSYARIFESKIIVDLLKIIGCGVEMDSKSNKQNELSAFDYNALKWNKIIICTDADEDGFQIRTLLLTLFYRLLPTLLQNTKVFIAESPLFEITCGKDTFFAYNEHEKTDILKKIGNKKYTLQRSKGLGENEPEMMWQTTMNPASRRLIAVTPTDPEATLEMFETLLGDALPRRKKFIAENAHKYASSADI